MGSYVPVKEMSDNDVYEINHIFLVLSSTAEPNEPLNKMALVLALHSVIAAPLAFLKKKAAPHIIIF